MDSHLDSLDPDLQCSICLEFYFEPLTLTWWDRGPVYGGDAATTNVSCLSPPRADARSLALEVSLNGQQYTVDTFGYVRLARLEPLAPDQLAAPRRPIHVC